MNRQIQRAMDDDETYAFKVESNQDYARAELSAKRITRLQYIMIMRDIEKGILPYID